MTDRSDGVRRLALAALVLAAGVADAAGPSQEPTPEPPPARIDDPTLVEASGLGASTLAGALLWSHDDSGSPPILHALGTDGAALGLVEVVGVRNVDWEDLAAFRWRGRAWLLIADTGDNDAVRSEVQLHVVREPRPESLTRGEALLVPVAWTLTLRFPDGPADCEAVGVDPREGRVYLLTKRTRPPVLYSVALHPARRGAPGRPIVARRERALEAFPDPGRAPLPTPASWFPGMPTGMSFAPDGTAAAVLTYDQVYLFPRAPGEPWAAALARPPRALGDPGLWQAEAITFTGDGRALLVTGEGKGQPLRRFELGAGTVPAAAAAPPSAPAAVP